MNLVAMSSVHIYSLTTSHKYYIVRIIKWQIITIYNRIYTSLPIFSNLKCIVFLSEECIQFIKAAYKKNILLK